MDEVYRGYRIAIKQIAGTWTARISAVRGTVVPVTAKSTDAEGDVVCAQRARAAVDRYVVYLAGAGVDEIE